MPRRRAIFPSVAAVAAIVVAGVSSCNSPPPSARVCPPPDAASADTDASACSPFAALFAASDYSSSVVGALALTGTPTFKSDVDLGADPALETSNGRAFFIARDRDTVFELNPACSTPMAEWSVNDGAGTTNPQDVAAAPDGSLWVPRFDVPSVAVVDACGARVATLDIASYDSDGNPNASAIVIDTVAGSAKAFVALERLDDHLPTLPSVQPSMMLRFDVASKSVEAAITLAGRNPFGLMREYAGGLYLAEPGNFDAVGEAYAGVERFDVATSTTALLATEAALGASVAEVAVTDGCAAAIVADATPNVNRTALVTFDPTTGAPFTTWPSPVFGPTDNFDLEALTWLTLADGSEVLLMGDRRIDAGQGYPFHVFALTAPCTLTEQADSIYVPLGPIGVRPRP
jgi:hypothetical protein